MNVYDQEPRNVTCRRDSVLDAPSRASLEHAQTRVIRARMPHHTSMSVYYRADK